ncbi:MAG: recombinase family protein [Firmicutes bacterium]|nr:recombinase family protein [Bacillota bacterium]
MNKTYCYIRKSTDKQAYDRQISVLNNAGYTVDNSIFVEETFTGTKKSRPLFDEMVENMQKGDTLVVESLSRLGRSLSNNNDIIDYLINNKQVNIKILKENFNLLANGRMDSTTKLLLNIFNCFAEFERDQLADRTKQGLKAAKEKGIKLGAKKGKYNTKENFIATLEYMINNSIGQKKACYKTYFPTDSFKVLLRKCYMRYNTKDYQQILDKIKEDEIEWELF